MPIPSYWQKNGNKFLPTQKPVRIFSFDLPAPSLDFISFFAKNKLVFDPNYSDRLHRQDRVGTYEKKYTWGLPNNEYPIFSFNIAPKEYQKLL